MHFFKDEPNKLAKELKASVLAAMNEHGVTQEMLADAIGVDRSTIARWFTYSGDLHFPASVTPMLCTAELRPVALVIIRFQARVFGVQLRINVSTDEVNGSLDDELLEVGRLEGKMIEAKSKNPRTVLRLCDEMDRITARMRLEIEVKK